MKCPICQHGEHSVVKAKQADNAIRRRRQCVRCGHRWNTYEGMADTAEELARLKRAVGQVADLVR